MIDLADQTEVTLYADSIVSIRTGATTTSLVLFRPTAKTIKAIREHENMPIALSIDDANGTFTPKTPQYITDFIWSEGTKTMIVETANQ